MPKKSKKEKILADLRRRVRPKQSLDVNISTIVKEEVSPTFKFQLKKKAVIVPQTIIQQHSTEFTAIKRDLYKTFILAALAITAELIIYWFRR